MKRLVVSGSRHWHVKHEQAVVGLIRRAIDYLSGDTHEEVEIHVGDCPSGVDRIVHAHFYVEKTWKADWKAYGPEAGPIRNHEMIDNVRPDLVLAFPCKQSTGTVDTYEYAKAQGYPTTVINYERYTEEVH